MNKKGYHFGLSFLFSILLGASILFMAIYGTTKFLNVEQFGHNEETSSNLNALLEPLETSFQSYQSLSLEFPVTTRISNICKLGGNFGEQEIDISQKSLKKYSLISSPVNFYDKYLFSSHFVEDKKFYLFSKPFKFPFKVASLIYLVPASKNYCFIGAPQKINTELENLGEKNLFYKDCSSEGYINVCFNGGDSCDISVNLYESSVTHINNGEKIYFDGDALMYGGIFSDKQTYECQVKRLIGREKSLIILYEKKANLQSRNGCFSDDVPLLEKINSELRDYTGSSNLESIRRSMNFYYEKSNPGCNLW